MTTLADGVKRLPKWARGLEALQSPQLQALAEQWQQQQAHLSSVHLHPHEVQLPKFPHSLSISCALSR